MKPKIDPSILKTFRDRRRPGDALLDTAKASERSLSLPAWIAVAIAAAGTIYAIGRDWWAAVWWVITGRL